MYIIGNLDFHSFDLEEYKYSEANITSFRMFSPDNYIVKEILDKMGHKYTSEILRNGELLLNTIVYFFSERDIDIYIFFF